MPLDVSRVTRAEFDRNGGNLWHTGKALGTTGGEVRRILVAGGFEIENESVWTKEEMEFVHRMVAMQAMIASKIAEHVGRNPAAVLAVCNQVYERPIPEIVKLKKVPYGKGYTKRNAAIRIAELAAMPGLCVLQYAKQKELDAKALLNSFKAYYPERMASIESNLFNVKFSICAYCGVEYADNAKRPSAFCSTTCNRKSKVDAEYFGGKRKNTLGVAEKTCQVCGAKHSALQVHHIIRKGNDQGNDYMIAICPGCHSVVSRLALHKKLSTNPEAVQALIALALAEMYGHELDGQINENQMQWFSVSASQVRAKLPCEIVLDLSDPLLG